MRYVYMDQDPAKTLEKSMETGESKEYIVKLLSCHCYEDEPDYGKLLLTDSQYELLDRYLPDHPDGHDIQAQYARKLLKRLYDVPFLSTPPDKYDLEYECRGCYAP